MFDALKAFFELLLRKDINSTQIGEIGAWYFAFNPCWYRRTATVAAHLVAVNVAAVAIVETRRKGSDASFLVQVATRSARMNAIILAKCCLTATTHCILSIAWCNWVPSL